MNFLSQFNKICEDPDLHTSKKFHYLVQSMDPVTRTHKVMTSYPKTTDNYEKVVAALKNRFGDNEMLVEVCVRQLIKIVMKNANAGATNTKLEGMYNELESLLRAWQSSDVTQK